MSAKLRTVTLTLQRKKTLVIGYVPARQGSDSSDCLFLFPIRHEQVIMIKTGDRINANTPFSQRAGNCSDEADCLQSRVHI